MIILNISLIFFVKDGSHVRLRHQSCVYTSEITFLALHPCPGVISVICNLLLIIPILPLNPPRVGRIIFPSSYLPKYLSNSTACLYNSSNINQWTLYINKINLNKQYSFLICCLIKNYFTPSGCKFIGSLC